MFHEWRLEMSKYEDYADLVVSRKACRECKGLKNPATIEGGRFDSDEIGPWTRWQGDLDARLMIVGQDWGGVKCLEDFCGKEPLGNFTNERLRLILGAIGVRIERPDIVSSRSGVFLTNAILCLKEGGLGAPVKSSWFPQLLLEVPSEADRDC